MVWTMQKPKGYVQNFSLYLSHQMFQARCGVWRGEKKINRLTDLYFGKCNLAEVGEQTEGVQSGCWGPQAVQQFR